MLTMMCERILLAVCKHKKVWIRTAQRELGGFHSQNRGSGTCLASSFPSVQWMPILLMDDGSEICGPEMQARFREIGKVIAPHGGDVDQLMLGFSDLVAKIALRQGSTVCPISCPQARLIVYSGDIHSDPNSRQFWRDARGALVATSR